MIIFARFKKYNEYLAPIFIFGASFIFSLAIFSLVSAVSGSDIVFPVKELGNCKNETECRTYCDKPQNIKVCLNFAEKYNLMPKEELAMARKFAAIGAKGPGGCTSKESCDQYCNDINNIQECVAFAEKTGIMPPEELEEAKKVIAVLASGAKLPGNCRSKNECDVYCNDSNHIEECIIFAEKAGFIPPDELGEVRQVLEAVRKGAKPPPCRGKKQCDAYCAEPNNFEQCITFAEAAGLVSPEEAKMARKTGGKGPGNCRGKEECDKFCEEEGNFEICVDFAVQYGLMPPEEAEIAKKTGGKGPGGCKGKEECEAFCQNPVNQETCFNFGKEHGLIPEEDLRRMEEGKKQIIEVLSGASPEVMSCIEETLGSETVEKLKVGTAMPSQTIGDTMRKCFEEVMGKMGSENGPGGGPNNMIGPPGSGGGLENAPPEVMECLRSAVGENVLENLKNRTAPPPPDFEIKMRSCFEQFGSQGAQENPQGPMMSPMNMTPSYQSGQETSFFSSLPPEVMNCLQTIYGSDFFEKMNSGQISPEQIQEKATQCMIQYQTQQQTQNQLQQYQQTPSASPSSLNENQIQPYDASPSPTLETQPQSQNEPSKFKESLLGFFGLIIKFLFP